MSSPKNEVSDVNNPPKAKTRRGLAKAPPSTDKNVDLSTVGIYTLQLDKFHQETKPNIDNKVIDIIKETEAQQQTKKPPKPVECVEELEIEPIWSSQPPPSQPLQVDDPSLYTGELGQLLKEIENTQLAFFQRNGLHVSDNSNDCCVILDETLSDNDITALVDDRPRNVVVRIQQKHRITKHSLSTRETFSKLIEELAIQNEVHPSQILLSLSGNTVTPNDTPESIGLEIADILDFSIAKEQDVPQSDNEEDKLCLKVQSKDFRSKMDIVINKTDPMSKLMEEYARRTNITDMSELIFKFDGDDISPDSTALELDLEDDYCIDVIVKRK